MGSTHSCVALRRRFRRRGGRDASSEAPTPVTFGAPEEFREYFKRNYGPTIAVYRALAEDPERVAALDRDLDDLARRFGIGSGQPQMEWEYLLLTARKRR